MDCHPNSRLVDALGRAGPREVARVGVAGIGVPRHRSGAQGTTVVEAAS